MNPLRQLRNKLKLITFDITGTLLTYKKPVGEQYAEAGFKYNIIVDPHLLTKCFSKQWEQMNEDHPNFGLACGMGWESWWHNMVYKTFTNAAPSLKLDEAKLGKISHYLTELYKGSECWQLCDGALDILEELQKSGISVGVISNFDPRLEQVLTSMKLQKYFKFVIASYSVGVEKPDKRIFELAVSLNNDETLKGCEVLHIGNSPTLDIQAALQAGWNACLIDLHKFPSVGKRSSDVLFEHPSDVFQLTVNNLYELKTLLFSP